MITTLTAFLAGLLFSLGLIVAGVVQPETVKGFLDVTGSWNPAAGLMLLSAVISAAPAFYWISRNRYRTLLRTPSFIPKTRSVDRQLVLGCMLFGVGWGLSGFDPGPGLIAAGSGNALALTFMVAVAVSVHITYKLDVYLIRRRRQVASSV